MARDPIARRRSARASADDEADVTEERSSRSSRRGRGGRSEAPAEEETTRRRPRSERAAEAAPPPRREARKGWGAAKEAQAKAGSGKYSDEGEFKAEEENTRYLLKPLEDEPFETAFEHFIWELDGRKSWSCEETKECPLCAVSDTPKPFSYLNVVDLNVFGKDDELIPETKYWRLSPDPAARLGERAEELAEKDRGLGDSDVYIVVKKTSGKKKGFTYTVDLVRARDLEDDWEMAPLTESELDDLASEMYDTDVIRVDSHKELLARQRELET